MKYFPLWLTWARIALVPVLVFVYYSSWQHAAFWSAITFAIAGITDWADGYFARKFQVESRFGAFLDPVADKLLVAVALLLLVEREAVYWMTLAAVIIISREIIISALREWMAETGQRAKVAVAWLGKWKTAMQITAIIGLLHNQSLLGLPAREIGLIALVIAVVLTIWSMLQYLRAAFSK